MLDTGRSSSCVLLADRSSAQSLSTSDVSNIVHELVIIVAFRRKPYHGQFVTSRLFHEYDWAKTYLELDPDEPPWPGNIASHTSTRGPQFTAKTSTCHGAHGIQAVKCDAPERMHAQV